MAHASSILNLLKEGARLPGLRISLVGVHKAAERHANA